MKAIITEYIAGEKLEKGNAIIIKEDGKAYKAQEQNGKLKDSVLTINP